MIELLVVITIIVILLALLTPALDKAIYQAELTACAAERRGFANGLGVYASSHKRRYPHRPIHNDVSSDAEYHLLTGWGNNDREIMEDYVNIDMLLCPLSRSDAIDIKDPENTGLIYLPSVLYAGRKPGGAPASSGMLKLGDRIGWDGKKYSVIVGDQDTVERTGNKTASGHPDVDGVMTFREAFDWAWVWHGIPTTYTQVGWVSPNTPQRGPVDLNFAMTDGSVVRVDGIRWNESTFNSGLVDRTRHYGNERDWFDTDADPTGIWQHLPK